MADYNCWRANAGWHPGCPKRIANFGGNPHVVCDCCLVVATIADTWYGVAKDDIQRGAEAIYLAEPQVGEAYDAASNIPVSH